MEKPFTPRDIRGVYGDKLTDDLFYKVGQAIPEALNTKKVVIGRDHRVSSPKLSEELIKGLTNMGCDVIDIGFSSSPTLSKENLEENSIGLIITASHNPGEYNGLKFFSADANYIMYNQGIDKVEELVNKNNFYPVKKKGQVIQKNVIEKYCNYIKSYLPKNIIKKIKIVVDTGNGVGGPFIEEIFRDIKNIKIIPLYFAPDGTYPNHEANPLKEETLNVLKETIEKEKADFGVAFDGDCDRCFIIDETGKTLGSEEFVCIATDLEIKETKQKHMVYFDIWFSQSVKDFLDNINCKHKSLGMGAGNYRKALIEEGGILASEFSGHIFYKENNCIDDGFFAFVKAISYYNQTQKKFSELRAGILKWESTNNNYKVKNTKKTMNKIEEEFNNGNISKIDGITIEFENWWFNIRPSLTEPIVRMKVEAKSQKVLEEKLKELESIINNN